MTQNQAVELRRNPLLPGQFFWQPRGVFRSLAAFAGSGSSSLGRVTDVSKAVSDRSDKEHPLLAVEIAGGKVIGDTILVSTLDDMVIGGLQGLHFREPPEDHWLLRRRRFRTTEKVRGTALMLSSNGTNYFHWLYDSLPRLKLIEQAGLSAADADWVVMGHDAPRFQEEMLEALRIPTKKIFRCNKGKVYQFHQLIVPSMPTATTSEMQPWMRTFLREKFLPAFDGTSCGRRIYLSRRNFNRRRMENEAALEEALHKIGFDSHFTENLDFAAQVKLFASAEFIVAPHGAALANLVFSNPGARLIELFHPDIQRRVYEVLAHLCGAEYRAITGTNTAAGTTDDQDARYVMEIAEVINAVAAVEQSGKAEK